MRGGVTACERVAALRRLPERGEVYLDHVGHFVSSRDSAEAALQQAGFTLTPAAIHTNPGPDGPVPAGTGNVCVMLDRGYVEVLFRIADTPLTAQFNRALDRYAGVHLAAFATAEADAEAARLREAGFSPLPPVHLGREVEGRPARFTVIRVPPERMPEGRIQFLTHHSEDVVWHRPWLTHANGARALLDLVLVVEAPDPVADRWAAFLGRPPRPVAGGWRIDTERGSILILSSAAARDGGFALDLPALPSFPAYGLEVDSLDRAETVLRQAGLAVRRAEHYLSVPFPAALGQGRWIMVQSAAALPWPR